MTTTLWYQPVSLRSEIQNGKNWVGQLLDFGIEKDAAAPSTRPEGMRRALPSNCERSADTPPPPAAAHLQPGDSALQAWHNNAKTDNG